MVQCRSSSRTAPGRFGRDNRLWHRLRQFQPEGWLRLKTAGKTGTIGGYHSMPAILSGRLNQKHRICALPEICC
jgi:hypothetical protein